MKKLIRDRDTKIGSKAGNTDGEKDSQVARRRYNPRIEGLIRQLGSCHEQNRAEAANTLMIIEHEDLIPAFAEALENSSESVQIAVTIIAGMIRDASIVPELIKAWHRKDSQLNKKDVIWALGEIRHVSAVPTLIEAFRSTNLDISEAASDALVKTGKEAVPLVAKELKSRDWSVQVCACEVLEKIGDESAIPALLVAAEDRNEMVRTSALGAVEEIRRKNEG